MPATYRFDFEQYTPEYWAEHRGRPSASNFDKIIQPKKGEMSSSARKYAIELVAERLSQNPNFFTDKPETVHMRNGINSEPHARRWYEYERTCTVRQCGLVIADDGLLCCSPDGLVGDEGGTEIKCPELKQHLEYVLDGKLPDDYKPQVHGTLLVTGRPWWDFVSYHPEAPQQLLVRVVPDEFTAKLRTCLDTFIKMYADLLEKVRSL